MISEQDKRKYSIEIIVETFFDNPRISSIIGRRSNKLKKVKIMAEYAYDFANKIGKTYLSEDKTAVVFFYKKSDYKQSFLYKIKYAITTLRTAQLSILKKLSDREVKINSLRWNEGDYVYGWFLAKSRKVKSYTGLIEAKNYIFDYADTENLPILIETTAKENILMYKRYGFEVYNKWHDEQSGLDIWFFKNDLTTSKSTAQK